MAEDNFNSYPDDDFQPIESEDLSFTSRDKAVSDEAFYTTALSDTPTPEADYENTKANLLQTGQDAQSIAVRNKLSSELNIVEDEVLFDELTQTPVELHNNVITEHLESRTNKTSVDLKKEFMNKQASEISYAKDIELEVYEGGVLEGLDEYAEANSSINSLLDEFTARFNGANAGADFVGMIAPVNQSLTMKVLMDDMRAKGWFQGTVDSSDVGIILPGEILVEMKDKLRDLPADEKVAFTKDILASIDVNSGNFSNNDMIKYSLILEVFNEINSPHDAETFDWDRLWENVSGVLDIAGLGGILVRTPVRVIKYISSTSPAHAILNSNPRKGSKVLAQGLEDERIAKTLGTTPDEIMQEAVLPKPTGTINSTIVPSDVVDNIKKFKAEGDAAVELANPKSTVYTPTEIDIARDRYITDLNLSSRSEVNVPMSTLGMSDDGEKIVASVMYQMNSTQGFASGFKAQERAIEVVGESGKYQIYKRRGSKIQKTKNLSGKGEYFFRIEHERFLHPDDAGVFNPDELFHGGGVAAKYLKGPESNYHANISKQGFINSDATSGLEEALGDIIVPFLKLGDESKSKVIRGMDEAARREKPLSYHDMVGRNWTPKEIKGYQSMSAQSDALYHIANNKYSRDLEKLGMKHLSNRDGWESMGKPINKGATTEVTHVYDPSKGGVRAIDQDEIAKLYDEGDTIVRLSKPEGVDDVLSNFAIISKTDKTSIKGLPKQILKYIPAYRARYYKDDYFVDMEYQAVIDGAVVTRKRTISAVGSKKDAIIKVNKLMETADKGVVYKPRESKALKSNENSEAQLDLDDMYGRMFFSKRGEHLKGLDGLDAPVEDGIDSILKSVSSLSRLGTSAVWSDANKARFVNSYSDLLKEKGVFPRRRKDITDNGDLRNAERVKEAQHVMDYINLIDNVKPLGATEWSGFVRSFAKSLENKGLTKTAKAIDNPVKFTKGQTFKLFLALNPFRQLPLQASGFTFVASLEPVFMLNVKSGLIPQQMGLAYGTFNKLHKTGVKDKGVVSRGAKMMGVSDKEYLDIVKDFHDSGLPASINSHNFSKAAMGDLSERLGQRGAFTKISDAGAKYGFNLGEYGNLSATYVLARFRYMKKNNKTNATLTKADKQHITGETRILAQGMSSAGQFGYQKGLLGVATQFVSIGHKTFMSALPKKLGGNKFFDTTDKLKIAAGQVLLFGTGAFGIKDIMTSVEEVVGFTLSPDVREYIEWNLVDASLNTVLEYATGEETNLKFSDSFNPSGGGYDTIRNFAMGVLNNETTVLEAAFGPSASAAGRYNSVIRTLYHTLSAPDLTNPDNLMESVNKLGNIIGSATSGYNNYLKASMAAQIGYHVNNSGDPVVKAAFAEAVGQFFGVHSAGMDNYYKLVRMHYGTGKQSKGGAAKHHKEIAAEYWKRVKLNAAKYASEIPNDLTALGNARYDEAIRGEAYIIAGLNEEDRFQVLKEFRKMVNREVRVKSTTFISDMVRASLNGDYGSNNKKMVSHLITSKMVNEKDEAALRAYFDELNSEDK